MFVFSKAMSMQHFGSLFILFLNEMLEYRYISICAKFTIMSRFSKEITIFDDYVLEIDEVHLCLISFELDQLLKFNLFF